MSPEERAAIEKQVDRHVRRGDVFEACVQLQSLIAAFPDENPLREKLINLEQSLDPTERRRVAMIQPESTGSHKSPVSQAEALAAKGKYRDAVEIYMKLLDERPDWDLVKERIVELELLQQLAEPPATPVNKEAVLERLLSRIDKRKR